MSICMISPFFSISLVFPPSKSLYKATASQAYGAVFQINSKIVQALLRIGPSDKEAIKPLFDHLAHMRRGGYNLSGFTTD